MPRHFRNNRRPTASLYAPCSDMFSGYGTRRRSTSPNMFSSAYDTCNRSPGPVPRRDDLDDLLSRTMRVINEGMCRREDRHAYFDNILNQEPTRWSRSSTPQGSSSSSRSLTPTPSEPREIFTLDGALTTHPFYTRHEIPFNPLDCASLYMPLERAETATVFHAIHPVPRRALRQLNSDELRFVSEELDERLYEKVEMDEFAEHVSETMVRINDLLERQGVDTAAHAYRNYERIALRDDVTHGTAGDDGVGSEETVVEELDGDV